MMEILWKSKLKLCDGNNMEIKMAVAPCRRSCRGGSNVMQNRLGIFLLLPVDLNFVVLGNSFWNLIKNHLLLLLEV